jgi:hypothetical protein
VPAVLTSLKRIELLFDLEDFGFGAILNKKIVGKLENKDGG